MLPDYPKVKARIVEKLMDRLRLVQKKHMSVFSSVPTAVMHEGERNVLTRETGSVDEMIPKQIEAEAVLEFDMREAEKLELPQVLQLIDALAEGLAREQVKMFLQSIEEAARSVGNIVDPGKKGIEAYCEMMEKRLLEFDDQGQPVQTQVLVGSEEAGKRVKAIEREIMETPELRRRYEAIIDKKREEWRDREIARNLVE